ncbi:MAG: dockerin type I repeat-containing protein [Oscillospiraceae bacterium]|nr:dockerin type I repeat-containing protein [Oscillospiraceae bacterium]
MRRTGFIHAAACFCLTAAISLGSAFSSTDLTGKNKIYAEESDSSYFKLSLNEPADVDYSEDGSCIDMYINNPGGESNGGKDKWDVQISRGVFPVIKGHTYAVTYNISSSKAGYYYSKIGNLDAKTVGAANSGEIWHNQSGITTITSYVEGLLKNNAKVDYSAGWSLQEISAGDTICAKSFFTSSEDLPEAEWVFFLGGDGQYTPTGCFTAGTSLEFTNMQIKDLTDDNVIVQYGVDEDQELLSLGNLDSNGKIDMTDLTILCQYVIGDCQLNRLQKLLADVNYDGKLDVADVAQLKLQLFGNE